MGRAKSTLDKQAQVRGLSKLNHLEKYSEILGSTSIDESVQGISGKAKFIIKKDLKRIDATREYIQQRYSRYIGDYGIEDETRQMMALVAGSNLEVTEDFSAIYVEKLGAKAIQIVDQEDRQLIEDVLISWLPDQASQRGLEVIADKKFKAMPDSAADDSTQILALRAEDMQGAMDQVTIVTAFARLYVDAAIRKGDSFKDIVQVSSELFNESLRDTLRPITNQILN